MRLPVKHVSVAVSLLLISGLGTAVAEPQAVRAAPTGPAADYPVIVGDPFVIAGTKWTPTDQLNYDAVGYAIIGAGEGSAAPLVGVTAAHKTLPLPSYVEVTSLDTGRTIVVRIVARGPMTNDTLIGLSEAAAAQLGTTATGRAPVRVRRVNPPEVERAALRNGGTVPPRMDTPQSLLGVLQRKLASQSPLLPQPSTPPEMPRSVPVDSIASEAVATKAAAAAPGAAPAAVSAPPKPSAKTAMAKSPPPLEQPSTANAALPKAPASIKAPSALKEPAAGTARPSADDRPVAKGTHVVQVAAFSSADRARKVAAQLGGQVSQAGRFWRVRLGPVNGSGEAARALEKAKAAGYSDARIQRAD